MSVLQVWNVKAGHQGYSNGVDGWHDYPNSAGGVSVLFSFKNCSEKVIKYITFSFVPYNAVQDPVCSTIGGTCENSVRFTGPLDPNALALGNIFTNAWYNSTIKSVLLTKVYIEYMDGTTELLNTSDINFSIPEGVSNGGCYVATAVYGSYDCPQVWTLRRYRDYKLAKTWYGRAFIYTYYAISPTLVKWFGSSSWFKNMWKPKLDRMVVELQCEGFSSEPYEDRNW